MRHGQLTSCSQKKRSIEPKLRSYSNTSRYAVSNMSDRPNGTKTRTSALYGCPKLRVKQKSLRANTIAPRRRDASLCCAARPNAEPRYIDEYIDRLCGASASVSRNIVGEPPCFSEPSVRHWVGLPRKNIVGRVRPPCFAGADGGGLERKVSHGFSEHRVSR